MVAFISTMIIMVMASVPSPISTEMSVAAARIRIIRSLNCARNIPTAEVLFFLDNVFGPCCSSLCFASCEESPLPPVCILQNPLFVRSLVPPG